MKKAIDHFLTCIAGWTPRWFNKPKFHIVLHLPEHVRDFGPAMLFATEGFEAFNAVIRAKSILSNRQAPSRDIAKAFASESRVRHFMSGGLFFAPLHATSTSHLLSPTPQDVVVYTHSDNSISPMVPDLTSLQDMDGLTLKVLRHIGPGPMTFTATRNAITHQLGLHPKEATSGEIVSLYITLEKVLIQIG